MGQLGFTFGGMKAEEAAIIAEAREILRKYISAEPVLSSYATVIDYLHTQLATEAREQFRVLFLDRKNRLIEDWHAADGTVDHVPVYPREIMRRALEVNASAIILAHNHPSGDPTPSRADIDMTKQVCAAAEALGVTVHDHIIIGADTETSFRAAGII